MGSPPRSPILHPPPWWPGEPLPWPAHRPGETTRQEPWLLQVDRRDQRVLAATAELEALLPIEDWHQVDRYRRPADRQRALLGRGVLRLVLGDWLGLDPASLRFAAGSHGKPELVGPCPATWHSQPSPSKRSQSKPTPWQPSQSERCHSEQFHTEQFDSEECQSEPSYSEQCPLETSYSDPSPKEPSPKDQCQEQSPPFRSPPFHPPQPNSPQFNLSHSGDLILLAFHATDPVGVDVERQRPDWDWRPIARRCLDAATVEVLLALAPAEAATAFVQAWCDLEAGIKARGVGLARASDGRSRAMERRLRRWRLALPAGYGGAVALLQRP